MVDMLQVAATLFALFALSRVFLRVKDGEISRREGLFWGVIWVLVLVLVYAHRSLNILKSVIDTRRPVDVVIYLSIMLLSYLVFRIYVKLDHVEQEITAVVRQETLQKAKKR